MAAAETKARAVSCSGCRRLERAVKRLEDKCQRLEQKLEKQQSVLEESRRTGKRQAAPFSKGQPKKSPRRPGRRTGKEHGPSVHRKPPEHVDQVLEAPVPSHCSCAGVIELDRIAQQYQVDIPPVRPHVIQFNVHIGHCVSCGRRWQGRHPQQTSDALGAAASQIGPQVQALACDLNKGLGLSFEKVSRVLLRLFSIKITRSGLCQAVARVARAAAPTYQAMVKQVRGSPVVAADETGWKVAGVLEWLWVFVGDRITVYAIQPGRGFAQICTVLGEDFAGFLGRDGWAPYRKLEKAKHQSCLAHLLYRCRQNIETALAGEARVPRMVQRLLRRALHLRDRRDRQEISPHGLATSLGHLRAAMDRLLRWQPQDDENRKLLKHLRTERDALFTFLEHPGIEATNWQAEQAIRPAVVTRKVCGGNRTHTGAATQQILTSVLRTCDQQHVDPYPLLAELLCSPHPLVAEVLLTDPSG